MRLLSALKFNDAVTQHGRILEFQHRVAASFISLALPLCGRSHSLRCRSFFPRDPLALGSRGSPFVLI